MNLYISHVKFQKNAYLLKDEIIDTRGQQTFSAKGQIVNILGFTSCKISVATTEFCHYKTKTAIGQQMDLVGFQ